MAETEPTLRQAENEVERLARKMAKDRGRAADAGEIGQLLNAVNEAYEAGRADTMAVVADAYITIFLGNDDQDGFRDALTEQMPAEWWAKRETVAPGQIWADNDPRSAGRTVRIEQIENGKAVCTILTNCRTTNVESPHQRDMRGKTTRISLARFKPTSTGYRLVEN